MFPARGENVKLGKGSLLLDLNDADGVPTGLEFVGNASAISLSADIAKAELFGSTQSSGALIASNITRVGYTLTATLNEFTLTNLKMFLRATENDKVQASATDAVVAISDVKLGRYYELGKRKVTGVTLLVGATPLVLNTDYTLNSEMGIIQVLESAPNIDEGDDITGTMDVPAHTITQLRIAQSPSVIGRLLYVSDDANSDGASSKDRLEVWKVDIAPDGELNVISDDYGAFNLTMAIISDAVNHPADPFGNLERVTV